MINVIFPQNVVDQLQDDVSEVVQAVTRTRPNTKKHPDLDRLEEDVDRLALRWTKCCKQVVDRLTSCEAACELLHKYEMSYNAETNWIDDLDSKLKNLDELEAKRAKEAWTNHVVRPTGLLHCSA